MQSAHFQRLRAEYFQKFLEHQKKKPYMTGMELWQLTEADYTPAIYTNYSSFRNAKSVYIRSLRKDAVCD